MKFFDKLLFALTIGAHAAVGLIELFAWAFGYEVVWTQITAVAVVLALLTLAAVVRLFCLHGNTKTSAFAIGLMLLTILTMLLIAESATYWIHIAMMLIAFAGVCKGVRPLWLKIVAVSLSAILVGVLVVAVGIATVLGGWVTGNEEVVSSVSSPDGTKEAQVIAVSNGAAGGRTVVGVRDAASRFDAKICVFEKPMLRLSNYETYGAHEDVTVTWVDNDTVSVYVAGEYNRTTEFNVG